MSYMKTQFLEIDFAEPEPKHLSGKHLYWSYDEVRPERIIRVFKWYDICVINKHIWKSLLLFVVSPFPLTQSHTQAPIRCVCVCIANTVT